MVVLAGSICTKSGKAVISRQFIEMTKSRIEGLLASFPKLISTGHQHTFVETDNVRYLYQPLDDLYLVLITNKNSNILQDIATLHLFARTVSEFCRQVKESEVLSKAFDLLIAFDEIVSLGYRENVTVSQIKTNIEMDSHEEKLQEMLQKSKEREAIEAAKLKAKQLEMQRKEAQKRGLSSGPGSFNSNSFSSARSPQTISPSTYQSNPISPPTNTQSSFSANPVAAGGPKKGMQLGAKPKISDMLEAIRTEEGIPAVEEPPIVSPPGTKMSETFAPPTPKVAYGSVHIGVDEKISAVINRDGGLDNLEVKGELLLRIADIEHAKVKLALLVKKDPSIQFKTHPHVDKNLWASQYVIATKDSNKPFPVGQPVPVLKWRYASKDEGAVPFTLNFWPSHSGSGTIECSVEYELLSKKLELSNVVVGIPIPSGSPKIDSVDGEYTLNPGLRCLEWRIPVMDANYDSGTLEFSIPGDEVSVLFPVKVSFTASKPFCDIDISGVQNAENGTNVEFTKEVQLSADDYRII